MEIAAINNYVHVTDSHRERDFKTKEIGGPDAFWKHER